MHTAGLLHDIGKFILPDSILQAERGLTAQDWELVKRHPAASADIVAQVPGYDAGRKGDPATTTSGSTAPATPTGCAGPRSRGSRG